MHHVVRIIINIVSCCTTLNTTPRGAADSDHVVIFISLYTAACMCFSFSQPFTAGKSMLYFNNNYQAKVFQLNIMYIGSLNTYFLIFLWSINAPTSSISCTFPWFVYVNGFTVIMSLILYSFHVNDELQKKKKKTADKSYTYCGDEDVFIYSGFGQLNGYLDT